MLSQQQLREELSDWGNSIIEDQGGGFETCGWDQKIVESNEKYGDWFFTQIKADMEDTNNQK